MRQIEVSEAGPAIVARDIVELEESLGTPVVDAYREFLLITNGGKPADQCGTYLVPSNFRDYYAEYGPHPSCITIAWFYATRYPDYEGYEIAYKHQEYLGRIPLGIIPFAGDLLGNQLCLGQDGVVFFWDQDLELEEEARNAFPVANSFGEFVDGLRGLPPEGA